MGSTIFFALAVGAGFVLLGLVVYSYVRPHPQHKPSVTALLGLLGFALIVSPNFTSISIRSEGLELSLIREMQARQLRALAEIPDLAATVGLEEDDFDSPSGAGHPSGAPPAPRSIPSFRRPSEDESDASDEPASPLSEDRKERLLSAFERGDLELRKLTNLELLALNERVAARNAQSTSEPDHSSMPR